MFFTPWLSMTEGIVSLVYIDLWNMVIILTKLLLLPSVAIHSWTGCLPITGHNYKHSHTFSHTADSLEMPISSQSMSLYWWMKLECLEETPWSMWRTPQTHTHRVEVEIQPCNYEAKATVLSCKFHRTEKWPVLINKCLVKSDWLMAAMFLNNHKSASFFWNSLIGQHSDVVWFTKCQLYS